MEKKTKRWWKQNLYQIPKKEDSDSVVESITPVMVLPTSTNVPKNFGKFRSDTIMLQILRVIARMLMEWGGEPLTLR